MYVDVCITEQTTVRFISVYLPHAGFPRQMLDDTYNDLRSTVRTAKQTGKYAVIGGDFNTQADVGMRGELLSEFASEFELHLCNVNDNGREEDEWTFESTLGYRRRIDYILASHRLTANSCGATDDLCLASDHRAVRACFTIPRTTRAEKRCQPNRPVVTPEYKTNVIQALHGKRVSDMPTLINLMTQAARDTSRASSTASKKLWDNDELQEL